MSVGPEFASALAAARSGEEWALSLLYRSLQPSVLRYLVAQESQEGEDLASEVWLDVAAGLTRFEGTETDFKRWAFTIASRRLIDHRRARARRRTQPVAVGTLDSRFQSEPFEPLDGAALSCLRSLPPEWAEIVLLRVVGGLDSYEVAAVTGRKPGTVRVIQKRALERLAELLLAEREGAVTR